MLLLVVKYVVQGRSVILRKTPAQVFVPAADVCSNCTCAQAVALKTEKKKLLRGPTGSAD